MGLCKLFLDKLYYCYNGYKMSLVVLKAFYSQYWVVQLSNGLISIKMRITVLHFHSYF